MPIVVPAAAVPIEPVLALQPPTLANIPDWFILAVTFVIGACVGSFLNVVIYRLPRRCLSIARPGSFCPVCKTPIRAWQNIPILSYIILGGRCAACRTPISLRYPIVELVTALLFTAVVYLNVVGPGFAESPWAWVTALTQIIFVSILLAAALIDADLTIIPNSLTLGGLAVILVFAAINPYHGGVIQHREYQVVPIDGRPTKTLIRGVTYERTLDPNLVHGTQYHARVAFQSPANELIPPPSLIRTYSPDDADAPEPLPPGLQNRLRSLLGALLGALIAGGATLVFRTLATAYFLRKALRFGQGQALGMGDVKLVALFGAMLGWPAALMSIFGGAVLGVLIAVPMSLANAKRMFPFGPFLAFAAIGLLLAHGPIVDFFYANYLAVFFERPGLM
jgi:leader peptidase (prepilin peptidase)/N-methyltransferase